MMQTFWTVFEYVVTIIEAGIVMYFVCSFLDHDFSGRKGKSIYILGVALFGATVMILNRFMVFEGVLGMLYILVVFLFALFFLNGTVWMKLLVAVGVNFILVATSALGSGLIKSISGQEMEVLYAVSGIYRVLMILMVQLLRIYAFGVILKFLGKGSVQLKTSEWMLIAIVFIISAGLFALVHTVQIQAELTERQTYDLSLAEAGLALVNVVCFAMTVRLSKNHVLESENILLKQQIAFREQYADNIRVQEHEMRTIRHDMKNSISVVDSLLAEGKISLAREYLMKLREEKLNAAVHLVTGNEFVNAIVNTRLSYAATLGIQVFCSSIFDFSGISDVDLCDLLGNLLDNAVEACQKCKNEKVIELKITSQDERILISVKNTVDESVLKKNPGLLTSKQEKKQHGFGVSSIRSIAEKYHGIIDYYEENGNFCSCVVLVRQLVLQQ